MSILKRLKQVEEQLAELEPVSCKICKQSFPRNKMIHIGARFVAPPPHWRMEFICAKCIVGSKYDRRIASHKSEGE